MHLIQAALSFDEADQATFDTPETAVSSVNGTTASDSFTSGRDGDWGADGVIVGADATHVAALPASHAERADNLTGSGEAGAAGEFQSAAAAFTLSWTISLSASWAMAGVNIRPVAGWTPTSSGHRNFGRKA